MTAAARLELRSISHSFFGVTVNKDISLSVAPGEVLGLVGENGAGKSTLMNIVGGVLQPTEGELLLDGDGTRRPARPRRGGPGSRSCTRSSTVLPAVGRRQRLLHRVPALAGVFTDRRAPVQTAAALELMDLPFSPNAVVEELSPGQRQMLEICKATIGTRRSSSSTSRRLRSPRGRRATVRLIDD